MKCELCNTPLSGGIDTFGSREEMLCCVCYLERSFATNELASCQKQMIEITYQQERLRAEGKSDDPFYRKLQDAAWAITMKQNDLMMKYFR